MIQHSTRRPANFADKIFWCLVLGVHLTFLYLILCYIQSFVESIPIFWTPSPPPPHLECLLGDDICSMSEYFVAVVCNMGMCCSMGGGFWYSRIVLRRWFLGVWGIDGERSVVRWAAKALFGLKDRVSPEDDLERGQCEKSLIEIVREKIDA